MSIYVHTHIDDSWWRARATDSLRDLHFSLRTRRALLNADLHRVSDLLDLDLDRLADVRGVGAKTVDEVALVRDVMSYRLRTPAPDRAACEATLPGNFTPAAWQTARKTDSAASLGLSKRSRNALLAAGAATVGDVLDLTLVELRARCGVGPSTGAELEALFRVLHRRFSAVSTPREESLDAYFEDICPRPPARRGDRSRDVLVRFLGLLPGRRRPHGAWPTQTAVAADLEISISAVHRVVSLARRRWRHSSRSRVRCDLKRILADHGGTLSAAEMAARLLARRGSAASPEIRELRAGAVVRAGAEGEASRGRVAWFRPYRRGGEVFVALRG